MGKVKKLKRLEARTRAHAERAEAAAARAEEVLAAVRTTAGEPVGEEGAATQDRPVYTAPQGQDALAPAAEAF